MEADRHMKYILVTGAFGGMGRAMTKTLSEKGFCIFALDKKVGKAKENISLVEMSGEEFERIIGINFFGAFYVNRTFLPLLSEGSRIIITTSELAPLDPLPFTGIYAVSKGALDKYAYSLCMELQLLGISVSVLRAGAVKTDMLGASTDALERFVGKTKLYKCNAERFEKIVDSVETRCVPPEKIANKVLYILGRKRPAFAYGINRNFLLLLLNSLPKRLQLAIIKRVLK